MTYAVQRFAPSKTAKSPMNIPENITFGILTDYVAEYHRQVIRGIQTTLERAGVSSVVFVGTDLTAENLPKTITDYFVGGNATYDLVSSRLNGLIALSASMGPTLNDDQLLGFLARYKPLPVVSVGRALPGIPSVVSQNPTGMRALMRHLIEDCGYRRFAFMRGIVGEPDSDAREQVFREALIEYHLEFHEHDMLNGEYFSIKAYEATRIWVPDASTEVIVCANDDMAFGVLHALEESGVNVPEDMAVTGFDDLETSQHCLPPLTSVRQPLFEMGVQAAQTMLKHHRKQSVEAVLDLPSALTLRESTRETTRVTTNSASLQSVNLTGSNPIGFEALRDEFNRSLLHPSETGQAFLRAWRNWMRTDQIQIHGPRLWQETLQHLLSEMPANLEPQTLQTATALWGRAHSLTISEGQVLRKRHLLSEQTGLTWYHDFDVELMSEANIPALTRNIVRFLPDLGLSRCYIALFETHEPTICETAQLVLAFEHGEAQPVDSKVFSSKNLLPATMQDRLHGHLYLQPLYVNHAQYGWIMFELEQQQAFYFDALRQTLSSGIHNAMQAKRLQDYTSILETRIQERTQALETSNDQLRAENTERRLTQEALRAANAQLRRATLQDGLTGVSNRAALDDYLERQLRSLQRSQVPLTFVMCDIDFFKLYNDHYGHLAGDRTLRNVAQVIKQNLLRSEDMIARYGGEEFALVLPNTDLERAKHVIERIQQTLADLNIPHNASPMTKRLTLSMGAISLIPNKTLAMHDLIHTADLGLYEAKAAGRNTVIWQTALRHDQTKSRNGFMLEPGV
jgi:diguanylate cyclase (GGDEF)-like protein